MVATVLTVPDISTAMKNCKLNFSSIKKSTGRYKRNGIKLFIHDTTRESTFMDAFFEKTFLDASMNGLRTA